MRPPSPLSTTPDGAVAPGRSSERVLNSPSSSFTGYGQHRTDDQTARATTPLGRGDANVRGVDPTFTHHVTQPLASLRAAAPPLQPVSQAVLPWPHRPTQPLASLLVTPVQGVPTNNDAAHAPLRRGLLDSPAPTAAPARGPGARIHAPARTANSTATWCDDGRDDRRAGWRCRSRCCFRRAVGAPEEGAAAGRTGGGDDPGRRQGGRAGYTRCRWALTALPAHIPNDRVMPRRPIDSLLLIEALLMLREMPPPPNSKKLLYRARTSNPAFQRRFAPCSPTLHALKAAHQ